MSENGKPPRSAFLKSVLGETDTAQTKDIVQTKDDNKKYDSRKQGKKDSLETRVAKHIVRKAASSAKESLHAHVDGLTDTAPAKTLTKQTKNLETTMQNNQPHAPAELSLAVVGHTNTGKTSLLRTLMRDASFGEVKDAAATTKHVERTSLFDGTTALIDLYDTPGLEDAGGLLDWLEDETSSRADGVERLHTFLASALSETDFNQEAKVLRQLLKCDCALYVIDVREPVLGKYKDELTVLSWCAKPVMPVFNFIHEVDDANLVAWQDMLARRGLHVHTGFDTVAFDFDGEMRLWQNLSTLLSGSATVDRFIQLRTREWENLDESARIAIAHLLLNVAAYKREIDEEDDPLPVLKEMQARVRQLERRLHASLLELYRFYDSDVAPTELKLSNFQRDPFDPELLKEYGIRTTSGAVAGALAGLGIDAATFGASLGLGAAIGGIIGGALSNAQTISDKLAGKQSLFIDPATVTLLATRAVDLLDALMHRGHAAQDGIMVHEQTLVWANDKLPSEIKKARSKPAWSELNTHQPEQAKTLREDTAWALARQLKR